MEKGIAIDKLLLFPRSPNESVGCVEWTDFFAIFKLINSKQTIKLITHPAHAQLIRSLMQSDQPYKKFHQHLYVQVLIAITIGILLGYLYPETATTMKPLGDGFIKLIKMIIAPIIFCTVVTGIGAMQDMDKCCCFHCYSVFPWPR